MTCRMRRRSWARTTRTNRIRQVSVGTEKKSMATVEPRWFLRNVARSARVASAGGRLVGRSSAQTRRIPASATLPECAARPRAGSLGPSLGSGVAGRRRPEDGRSSERPSGPKPREGPAMPRNDGGGSYDYQGRIPVWPRQPEADPEQPVAPTKGRLRTAAMVDGQLLPQ